MSHTPHNTLGSRIKANRKKLGLSMEETAQRLSVSRMTLHRWEHGQVNPSYENYLQLKELLDL